MSCSTGGALVSFLETATTVVAGGSEAGNDSADASSAEPGAALGSGSDDTSVVQNISLADFSGMLSCGRDGPARHGSTLPRSSSRYSEYTGSGFDRSCHSPCSLAYASTRAICSALRPVKRRYRIVSSSMG